MNVQFKVGEGVVCRAYSKPSEEPKSRMEDESNGVATTGPSVVKFHNAVPLPLPRVCRAYTLLSKDGT